MFDGARELWAVCKEDPDYEVSTMGRVRKISNGRILRQSLNKPDGYYRVALHRTKYYVHRLMVNAFFDCDITDKDINHIDGDKCNNFLGNLEVMTRKENIRHAVDNGMFHRSRRKDIETVQIVRCYDCDRRHTCDLYNPYDPYFFCSRGV